MQQIEKILANNLGNRITQELIYGLLASISFVVAEQLKAERKAWEQERPKPKAAPKSPQK